MASHSIFPPAQTEAPRNPGEARAQDVDYLRAVFGRLNKSFTRETRQLFEARLRELQQHLDVKTRGEFVMGISRSIAAAGDGHTRVLFNEHLAYAPVRFHWFSDGLYVVRAKEEARGLLGAQVVDIGKSSPRTILERLGEYLGGTHEHIRAVGTELLNSPDALQGIGALPDSETLPLHVKLRDGSESIWNLSAQRLVCPRHWYRHPRFDVAAVPINKEGWRHVLEAVAKTPLYLDSPEASTHDVILSHIESLYLRISATVNLPDRYLDDYLDDVLKKVGRESPRHFIIDLRFNQGGDFLLAREFATRLPELLGERGKLFVITGNHTFSAGLVVGALLKYYAKGRAVIVGEKMGDGERFWAEGGVIRLPNSGLPVCLTDGFHDWAEGCADEEKGCPWYVQLYAVAAGSLAPDIEVALSFSEYLEGRDSVMERVEAEILRG